MSSTKTLQADCSLEGFFTSTVVNGWNGTGIEVSEEILIKTTSIGLLACSFWVLP